MAVAPFKVGPDFIDPGHHGRITGVTSRNLDGWMLSKRYNRSNFERHCQEKDLAIVEGVMGLYDGYDGKSEAGSTAQMAKWLDLPAVLIVNAKSMARSAAALVAGFEGFDPDLEFAGVIFNKLGSRRHLDYLVEAMEGHVDMPVLGGIYRNEEIAMPERHLGLVTADDNALSAEKIDLLADLIEENIDTELLLSRCGILAGTGRDTANGKDRIETSNEKRTNGSDAFEGNAAAIRLRGDAGGHRVRETDETDVLRSDVAGVETTRPDADVADIFRTIKCTGGTAPSGNVRIGIPRDSAFCFYYQDNLELLQACGADVVFFSPLSDRKLPEALDGIYLGGGYPELHAKTLSENTVLNAQIRQMSQEGMPMFGECGGFMYLCSTIVDREKKAWPMTGCLPFTVQMLPRLRSLGYREITLAEDTVIGKKGLVVRGHEFHYSEVSAGAAGARTVFTVTPRSGKRTTEEGYRRARTLGGYLHLHFGSQPAVAETFVAQCRNYKEERINGV